MSHDLTKFIEEIFELSECKDDWNTACSEWMHFRTTDGWSSCICGVGIFHNYHISNMINDNQTIVGCVCVRQFTETSEVYISINEEHRKRINRRAKELRLQKKQKAQQKARAEEIIRLEKKAMAKSLKRITAKPDRADFAKWISKRNTVESAPVWIPRPQWKKYVRA